MKKNNRFSFIAVLLIAALVISGPMNTRNAIAPAYAEETASHEILPAAEAAAQSLQMAEQLEAEGIVLLRNENGALPLAAGAKVNLFGYASVDPIYGGTGSGAGDTSGNVDVIAGLKNAGLEVNEQLADFYRNSGVSRIKQSGFSGSDFTPAEVPAASYPESLLADARAFSDTAVIVISRIGGEGGDLPMNMHAAGYTAEDDGRHYLELTRDEEDLLALVKGQGYAKVIVLVNASNVMELGFAEGVDACLWIGSPGTVGFNAVGKALTGEVNPSGRLTDTYAYDLTSSPAYWNAGDFSYSNLSGRSYVEYAEGIYVGYRYYETAAADGAIDYAATVQYPFGYGLSYTNFEQSIESFAVEDGIVTMRIRVVNTGSAAGKDVVQVYYTAPYTPGGIEKAHVVLAGFAKTALLQPGESETLPVSFPAEDMASFDSKENGCYVLEAGTYEIKLMHNAHDVIDSREYIVENTVIYNAENPRSSDQAAAVTRFSDVENGQIEAYVSRSDWAGTLPQTRVAGKEAPEAVVEAFTNKAPYAVNENDPEIVFADNGLKLGDMTGLAWDDPKWDLLLQQLSVEDMSEMILKGGWSTPAIESVGKPATADIDGPAGLNSLISSLRGVSFPSEVVIGSTWNAELVEAFGGVFAEEAKANGVAGLYAPGMNIHRTPFSGRNFEYYSEDGLLSGKLGAAQVRGAASEGVYLYAKHFVLNDQDENRLHLSVWSNEQAMREVYFRPFEITVKEGKTTAVMSSYSYLGTTWAGASRPLITDVLRGEWGFTGMVVTDSAMANIDWMDPNLAIRSGNDMMLCLMGATLDTSSNTAQTAMREACHNILYTQANSAAMWVNPDLAYPVKEAAPAEGTETATAGGMELYDLADGWLGCHVYLNEDGAFSVAFDYGGDSNGIVSMTGAWEQVSDTAITLHPESGKDIPVTLDNGAWKCEVTEPNTHTVCHPKAEAAADETAAAVSPENGMELYDLSDGWLGCHVNISADNTFAVAYDYSADYAGIVAVSGTWERVSDTELMLHPESGDDIPVTLADSVWSCEVIDPNTQTVCHPKLEVGEPAPTAESAQPVTYTVIYTDADGIVYQTVETADASALPEVEIPVKEGFHFAGWQTRPNVTRDDLILGVSPYEVPAGASSLYGGAGTAIDSLESTDGATVTVYARWVAPVYIHTAEELQALGEDLYGWYVLAEDIDLSGRQWIPVGMYFSNYETVNAPYWTYAFRGTLDGAGHTISGLTIGNWLADVAAMEGTENAVWRNDGTYSGSEAAFFGAMAKAEVRDLVFDHPIVSVTSDGDATPYAAVVAGFDIGSTLAHITVTEPSVIVNASDSAAQSRASAWAAASALVAGGWSDTITGCTVTDAKITLNGEPVRSHGGEYYVGALLGEGYAFMDENSATYELNVSIEDRSQALTDTELIVNVGGMGGTNTTQTNGTYTGTINVRVVKPAGASTVSIGGLTGSQRYQVAENNTLKADITTDLRLDPDQGKVYVGQVIGSTNVPYCIVQLIFAAPGTVDYSGCRNNQADVTLNGEAVTAMKGQALTVKGEALPYIANGDLTVEGASYTSNINDVIAEYGSAVPAAFLQNAVIVLVDEP